MLGIRFEIKNEWDSILNKIFYEVDFSECVWKIVEDDVHGKELDRFFSKDEYSNDEFMKIIKEEHYPVALNLQMFLKSKMGENVYSYNEFLKSSCQLVLIIVDNIFVDIYAKNENVLKKIHDNAVHFGFTDVIYINDISEVSLGFMKGDF